MKSLHAVIAKELGAEQLKLQKQVGLDGQRLTHLAAISASVQFKIKTTAAITITITIAALVRLSASAHTLPRTD